MPVKWSSRQPPCVPMCVTNACPCVAFVVQMAELLMEKLPGIYCTIFLKEGVVHAMDQLAAAGAPAASGAEPAAEVPEDKASKGLC